ncbi:hypothetical protein BJ508DRAFT_306273 [Ascobolus immersus RN42]|uniref:Uncharacterized protein n=1 Tax=Ascobolus immersus RN42 TaxID=1160509 RepID=A0A3N4IAF6_ASCIM|nr:hypothetical protein BJ508DRAFT_306273 [Ascobolus immersus RN42]
MCNCHLRRNLDNRLPLPNNPLPWRTLFHPTTLLLLSPTHHLHEIATTMLKTLIRECDPSPPVPKKDKIFQKGHTIRKPAKIQITCAEEKRKTAALLDHHLDRLFIFMRQAQLQGLVRERREVGGREEHIEVLLARYIRILVQAYTVLLPPAIHEDIDSVGEETSYYPKVHFNSLVSGLGQHCWEDAHVASLVFSWEEVHADVGKVNSEWESEWKGYGGRVDAPVGKRGDKRFRVGGKVESLERMCKGFWKGLEEIMGEVEGLVGGCGEGGVRT